MNLLPFSDNQIAELTFAYKKLHKEILKNPLVNIQAKPTVLYRRAIEDFILILSSKDLEDFTEAKLNHHLEFIKITGAAVRIMVQYEATLRQVLQNNNLAVHLKDVNEATMINDILNQEKPEVITVNYPQCILDLLVMELSS